MLEASNLTSLLQPKQSRRAQAANQRIENLKVPSDICWYIENVIGVANQVHSSPA